MKKRLGFILVFVLILLETIACKKPIEKTKPSEDEDTEVMQEVITSEESEEIEVQKKEYGSEEIHLVGEKLDQLTVTGTDDTFYCNLEENIKMERLGNTTKGLVCKDPVYDITYYVNYGRDYYIYAYRNGETQLAAAIPAKDLYCREGELYFIADTFERYQFSGFAQGNILKYNPKDGTVAVVVDSCADRMMVYSDGICYMQSGTVKQITEEIKSSLEERFFFSFATEKNCSLPENVTKLRRWNGYLLQEQQQIHLLSETDPLAQYYRELGFTGIGVGEGIEAISLVDMQGNVKETLQNVKGLPDEYLIIGDTIFYVEQRKEENETESRSILRKYHIQTGINEEVAKLSYPTDLCNSNMIICNNVAYFGNGLRVKLDSGEQCYMQNTDGTAVRLDDFFTDGENLFCVSDEKLWMFEEQQQTPLNKEEFIVGEPLEIGTYVYSLYEPGKQK